MSDARQGSVLLYDGECSFCIRSVEWARARLPIRLDARPWQDAELASFGLTEAEARHAVQWVEPSGRLSAGHTAVGRLLVAAGGGWALLGRLALVPPASWVAAGVYRLVAATRRYLPS
ncbi:MAG TPA: DCC1-like thiol-disulfide oxidoreductase family protein [Candidatus Eisenbacteria bacterium]|nr:DCC1-like thiol-disulfide oxidoreductase family protein [Candidatus Eisenbacteria bacterium]